MGLMMMMMMISIAMVVRAKKWNDLEVLPILLCTDSKGTNEETEATRNKTSITRWTKM